MGIDKSSTIESKGCTPGGIRLENLSGVRITVSPTSSRGQSFLFIQKRGKKMTQSGKWPHPVYLFAPMLNSRLSTLVVVDVVAPKS